MLIAIADSIVTSENSGSAIVAFRLEEEPDDFFVIEDPDSFFLEAIVNEGEPVFLGFFGETSIDELITFYNPCNVAYLDEFYSIGRLSVDAFGFGPYLLQFTFVGWTVLIIFGFVKLFSKGENSDG